VEPFFKKGGEAMYITAYELITIIFLAMSFMVDLVMLIICLISIFLEKK
jgi:hypothetical protein